MRLISDNIWEIDDQGTPVNGRVFLSNKMVETMDAGALKQVGNVAALRGCVASMGMPDIHSGYGLPIGGVGVFRLDTGVITPGGVGYDINCGVRLLVTEVTVAEMKKHLDALITDLYSRIPSGMSHTANMTLTDAELEEVFAKGAAWMVQKGYGEQADLMACEEGGSMPGATPSVLSKKVYERGRSQLGTLGGGNHFIEIQSVEEVFDPVAAARMGLVAGNAVIMIHTGSRGAGHQICTDYTKKIDQLYKNGECEKYGIKTRDRELGCAPIDSPEGEEYFSAMVCGANYAWANRQLITHLIRQGYKKHFGGDLGLVYDVTHNIAKKEEHNVNGEMTKLLILRKGATRAFAPGRKEIPEVYRSIGQPVLIPGSMGTASYVLTGTQKAMDTTFGSSCHGSGRVMGRNAAGRAFNAADVKADMAARGVLVRAPSDESIVDECPGVYKDISEVIEVVSSVGIAKKTARMRPLAVMKG